MALAAAHAAVAAVLDRLRALRPAPRPEAADTEIAMAPDAGLDAFATVETTLPATDTHRGSNELSAPNSTPRTAHAVEPIRSAPIDATFRVASPSTSFWADDVIAASGNFADDDGALFLFGGTPAERPLRTDRTVSGTLDAQMEPAKAETPVQLDVAADEPDGLPGAIAAPGAGARQDVGLPQSLVSVELPEALGGEKGTAIDIAPLPSSVRNDEIVVATLVIAADDVRADKAEAYVDIQLPVTPEPATHHADNDLSANAASDALEASTVERIMVEALATAQASQPETATDASADWTDEPLITNDDVRDDAADLPRSAGVSNAADGLDIDQPAAVVPAMAVRSPAVTTAVLSPATPEPDFYPADEDHIARLDAPEYDDDEPTTRVVAIAQGLWMEEDTEVAVTSSSSEEPESEEPDHHQTVSAIAPFNTSKADDWVWGRAYFLASAIAFPAAFAGLALLRVADNPMSAMGAVAQIVTTILSPALGLVVFLPAAGLLRLTRFVRLPRGISDVVVGGVLGEITWLLVSNGDHGAAPLVAYGFVAAGLLGGAVYWRALSFFKERAHGPHFVEGSADLA